MPSQCGSHNTNRAMPFLARPRLASRDKKNEKLHQKKNRKVKKIVPAFSNNSPPTQNFSHGSHWRVIYSSGGKGHDRPNYQLVTVLKRMFVLFIEPPRVSGDVPTMNPRE